MKPLLIKDSSWIYRIAQFGYSKYATPKDLCQLTTRFVINALGGLVILLIAALAFTSMGIYIHEVGTITFHPFTFHWVGTFGFDNNPTSMRGPNDMYSFMCYMGALIWSFVCVASMFAVAVYLLMKLLGVIYDANKRYQDKQWQKRISEMDKPTAPKEPKFVKLRTMYGNWKDKTCVRISVVHTVRK